jgi:hypothetical protein
MQVHRGRGSSGLSPSSRPTSTAPPSYSKARTEFSCDRAASLAAAHRHRPSPTAVPGGEPLPLQPKPSCLHESKHRMAENAWVCLFSQASSPPTSLSSPELAVRRPHVPLSLTVGPRLSGATRGRDGRAGRACVAGRARASWSASFPGPAQ